MCPWLPGISGPASSSRKRELVVLNPVPTERLCPGAQLYSDCVSSCPPTCMAVGQGEEGSCREECVSGCECPPGLFWDGAQCVPAARCPCYHRRQRYAPGDTVRQLCNLWWVLGPYWEVTATWFPLIPCLMLSLKPASPKLPAYSGASYTVTCDLSWYD